MRHSDHLARLIRHLKAQASFRPSFPILASEAELICAALERPKGTRT